MENKINQHIGDTEHLPPNPTDVGTAPVLGTNDEIISGTRLRSNAEARARAFRAAAGFRQLGVETGDAIALLLRNDFEFFEASLAAGYAGAYAVPINWHSTADEASYVLKDSGAKLLVIHRDLLERLAGAIDPGLPVLVVATPPEISAAYGLSGSSGQSMIPTLDWETWMTGFAPLETPNTDARSAVIYTSGTTGRPKGVRREPDRTGAAARLSAVGFGMGEGLETVLMNGPMYHTAPNSYGRLAFELGARIILQPRFDPEEMLQLIERYRVTHMHIVPTMFVRLLRLPADIRAAYDLGSLRSVVHGAAPCPPELKRQMIDWWGPVINEYYGATEAGLIATHNSDEAVRKPGTVGRALPGVTVRIVGGDGRDLPAGQIGDIYVQTPGSGNFNYIGLKGKRDEITLGTFITVGDIGYLDEEGYLFLCDRRNDMIISGGVNIYPAEIEAALQAQPDVADAAVFGVADAEFGQSVCAYVQPSDIAAGVDVDALRLRLETVLSKYKVPRIFVVQNELPREDSGKIFKRKLREAHGN